jgi:hypothetical protein
LISSSFLFRGHMHRCTYRPDTPYICPSIEGYMKSRCIYPLPAM